MEIAGTADEGGDHGAFDLDGALRRLLDIVASLAGLMLLAPVFLIIAIAIKQDSPGPVFFRGPRAGRGGHTFGILKFRTMYECPESYKGPKVTGSGDVRITPLGQWLRDHKANELPQLWNVLVGDMSLVGPRPEDPDIVLTWPAEIREELLAVRPGITSPATIIYRGEEEMLNSGSLMDDYIKKILPDKLRLDRMYLRRRSLLTDLDVILMTTTLLLPNLRRTQVPAAILYWGPVARFIYRYLSWFVVDTLTAAMAVGTAGLVWRLENPLNIGLFRFLMVAVIMGLLFSLINYLLGLQHVAWSRAPSTEVIPLTLSAVITVVLLELINYTLPLLAPSLYWDPRALPAGLFLVAGMLAWSGFVSARYRERLFTGLAWRWVKLRGTQQVIGERVLLVGAGENSRFATWLLTRRELANVFTVVGIVDDDPRKQGLAYDGVPVMGVTADLLDLVQKYDIGVIVYTINNIDTENRIRILSLCQATKRPVVMLAEAMDEILGKFLIVKGAVVV